MSHERYQDARIATFRYRRAGDSMAVGDFGLWTWLFGQGLVPLLCFTFHKRPEDVRKNASDQTSASDELGFQTASDWIQMALAQNRLPKHWQMEKSTKTAGPQVVSSWAKSKWRFNVENPKLKQRGSSAKLFQQSPYVLVELSCSVGHSVTIPKVFGNWMQLWMLFWIAGSLMRAKPFNKFRVSYVSHPKNNPWENSWKQKPFRYQDKWPSETSGFRSCNIESPKSSKWPVCKVAWPFSHNS